MYRQPRPSRELLAKDLHGLERRSRHIYRSKSLAFYVACLVETMDFECLFECILGQPRRYLQTTGWIAFVNKKKLVSGDDVLFLIDDGKLRLGVRRASQIKLH
ncbi:unnamed protein product [Cochlearia groenlandica]